MVKEDINQVNADNHLSLPFNWKLNEASVFALFTTVRSGILSMKCLNFCWINGLISHWSRVRMITQNHRVRRLITMSEVYTLNWRILCFTNYVRFILPIHVKESDFWGVWQYLFIYINLWYSWHLESNEIC